MFAGTSKANSCAVVDWVGGTHEKQRARIEIEVCRHIISNFSCLFPLVNGTDLTTLETFPGGAYLFVPPLRIVASNLIMNAATDCWIKSLC